MAKIEQRKTVGQTISVICAFEIAVQMANGEGDHLTKNYLQLILLVDCELRALSSDGRRHLCQRYWQPTASDKSNTKQQ